MARPQGFFCCPPVGAAGSGGGPHVEMMRMEPAIRKGSRRERIFLIESLRIARY